MKMKKGEKKSGERGDVYKGWKLLFKEKKGRCERRSEAFVKIQKKNIFFLGGGGGGQGGSELRSEVFVKIQKKKIFFGGGGGLGGGRGVRVDVNGEVKLL